MSKFNALNTNYKEGKYPLFLGQTLGLADTVNVTYPQLEAMYQKQLSQIWNEFEVDLTQDRMDMNRLPFEVVRPMQQTISWQSLADAVAARSISEVLLRHCTNPELEHWINLWSFFETIHNRTYAHIIKQTFQNPVEMLEDTYNNTQVLRRSDVIVKALDAAAELKDDTTDFIKRRVIIKALVAIFALESIAFMASFAVTFGIAETGSFQGIGQLVTLICRDEMLHARVGLEILSILRKDPDWKLDFLIINGEIQEILDAVYTQETEWAEHIFKDGSIPGQSAERLKSYVDFISLPIYKVFGLESSFPGTIVDKLPLHYMTKYIDSSNTQVAAQELQITSYQIGIIKEDADNFSLDTSSLDLVKDYTYTL